MKKIILFSLLFVCNQFVVGAEYNNCQGDMLRSGHPGFQSDKYKEPELNLSKIISGMWGSEGYQMRVHKSKGSLGRFDKKEVVTPCWEALGNVSSQKLKNQYLQIAHNTNADIDGYPHWRANVAAALFCGASLVDVQNELMERSEFLLKAVMMDDVHLMNLLFKEGISQEVGYVPGALLCVAKKYFSAR